MTYLHLYINLNLLTVNYCVHLLQKKQQQKIKNKEESGAYVSPALITKCRKWADDTCCCKCSLSYIVLHKCHQMLQEMHVTAPKIEDIK